jgi:hypothetical protein
MELRKADSNGDLSRLPGSLFHRHPWVGLIRLHLQQGQITIRKSRHDSRAMFSLIMGLHDEVRVSLNDV